MKQLTELQKKYLQELLDIQKALVFNNGRQAEIQRVIHDGCYDDDFAKNINSISVAYKDFKETGNIQEWYQFI